MGKIVISMRDHTNEKTTFSCPSVDLNDLNINTEYAAAIALQNALADVSLGNITNRNHIAKSSPQGIPGPAVDATAQREAKAMCIYANTITFAQGKMEIPVIDLTKQMAGHPGFFYLADYPLESHADWQAFVAALEAVLSQEAGGDAVEVQRVYHIGKNT